MAKSPVISQIVAFQSMTATLETMRRLIEPAELANILSCGVSVDADGRWPEAGREKNE
jgi:hypothetical protein